VSFQPANFEGSERMAYVPAAVDRRDGLTGQEGIVMDYLVAAVNAYSNLPPPTHPMELGEFIDGIHRCQDLLAIRVARRHYPEGWQV
jgi:hypothetical protein